MFDDHLPFEVGVGLTWSIVALRQHAGTLFSALCGPSLDRTHDRWEVDRAGYIFRPQRRETATISSTHRSRRPICLHLNTWRSYICVCVRNDPYLLRAAIDIIQEACLLPGFQMGSTLQPNNVLATMSTLFLPPSVSNSVHQGSPLQLWTSPDSINGLGHL